MKLPVLVVLSNLLITTGLAQETVSSIPPQDEFFRAISELCGKAFAGTVTIDNDSSDSFANKKLIMHVRRCDETQLQIPFHVGENASRTWVITKTGSGLSLKHDHRHRDGTEDVLTQYGGHTVDAGWAQVQSFPADQYSKELFVANAIPQSVGNTWQMYIYPGRFTYRLVRQGREFRVDFDLTRPVDIPPAPWGYEDTQDPAEE
jgi:hypothetical protein